MIDRTHPTLPVTRQCRILNVSRATVYRHPAAVSDADLELMALIDRQYLIRPFYGSRRMAAWLNTQGHAVNRKRLMRLMGLVAIYQRPNTSKAAAEHVKYPYLLGGLTIDRVNQVWCSDITYIPMPRGFLYLVVIMDWHSRAVLSWRLSNTLHADFCVEALEEALRGFGRPEIFNTDQGSQFTSDDFIGVLKKSQIKISMDGKGRCMDKSGIGAWLHFYNEERLHQTHDYRTPRQVYEAQYRWICGRSASPTGCAFDHITTGTTISKGFNNDGSKGIVTVAAPP
jgi:putative transposase